MCEWIEEYIDKMAKEAAIKATIKTWRKIGASEERISKEIETEYNLSYSEAEAYLLQE